MQIKPSITDLSKILSGEETKYCIPKYQRDYSWKYNEEVEELWNDIIFSYKQNFEYFIGNVVLNANGDINSATEFDVVDGQQRLTTFSILFNVVYKYSDFYLKTNGEDSLYSKWNFDDASRKIVNKIAKRVIDRLVYYGEPDNFYLELNKKDQPIFRDEILGNEKVFRTEDELKIISNESRLKKTEKYLSKKIIQEFIKRENGYNELNEFVHHLIKKLKINSIKVGEDYDAYLLFESLNSKGMSLSQSDLIKNKILMLCNNEEEYLNRCIEHWEKIEMNISSSRNNIVDFFYYHWLTFETIQLTKKTLYKNVRQKLNPYNPEKIVEYIKFVSKTSHTFIGLTEKDLSYPSNKYKKDSLEQFLAEIQVLNYSICIPAIFYLKYNNSALTKDLARLSIAFLFRTITIGELQVRKAKDTFDQILNYLKEDSPTLEVIQSIFISNCEIDNAELTRKFLQKTFSNSLGKYVLTKILEHELGSETVVNEVDLEHILPISFEKNWSDFNFYGRKPEDVIGNIGNLTLLNPGNNRGIKNSNFVKKVPYYKKRTKSEDKFSTTIKFSYEVHQEFEKAGGAKKFPANEFWTISKIDARAKKLALQINEIWTLK